MSAKEMFEKLGYKQICNDANYIIYRFDMEDMYSEIKFYKPQQDIEIEYTDKILNTIDLGELQAINQQVKELGW